MTSIPLAYVTARFPPMTSSGTFRVEAMMRHLPELGYSPRVLTLPAEWVRQQSGVEPVITDPPDVLRPRATTDRWVRSWAAVPVVRGAVREIMVPDILASWARRVPAQVASDVSDAALVYATAPPFSALVAAQRLGAILDVPVVQEVRDPPSFNRRLRGRSRSTIRRMLAFEREYLGRADAVIVVTQGTRTRLLELHPDLDEKRVHVVTNGYPPIDPEPERSGRDPDTFTVTYVGTYQGGAGSWFNPEIILPDLARLPGRWQLRVVGKLTDGQKRSLRRYDSGRVEAVGEMDREVAIAEMAAADVSLVLAEDDPWWIGRKVFEYLAFARRILAIVPPGDTADLLSSSSKSLVVHPDQAGALGDAISVLHRRWLDGEEPSGPEPPVQTDFNCVVEAASVLDGVLGRDVALGR